MSDPILTLSDLNLKDLNAFVSVATTGSFRAAAKALYSSQPAISRSIARLETKLATVLLVRGPRGASPTDAGRKVLVHAQNLTAELRLLHDGIRHGWTNVVRLGIAATAAGSYLAPFLAQWIPKHPDTRVDVLEDGAANLAKRLENRECDIAIIQSPSPIKEFEAYPLTRVTIRAHFLTTHPLARLSGMVQLRDLAPHPLLINDQTFLSARLLENSFLSAAIQPDIVFRSASGHTLAALAKSGMGVAVFGDSVAVKEDALTSLAVSVDGVRPLGFNLGVAWRKQGTPEYVRAFGAELSRFYQP